jgi:hypothetical protein
MSVPLLYQDVCEVTKEALRVYETERIRIINKAIITAVNERFESRALLPPLRFVCKPDSITDLQNPSTDLQNIVFRYFEEFYPGFSIEIPRNQYYYGENMVQWSGLKISWYEKSPPQIK